MFDGIYNIHKTDRVHRDIKLDNIRVHGGKVYITDFGCIYKVYKDNGKQFHLPERGNGFSGTAKFASINAHEGKNLSFRDDLECLGYSMVALYTGENGYWYDFDPRDHR
jgi:serine/threonine protein kinase